jgi:putative endonuclease
MSRSRQVLGRWGENIAADYLSAKGYLILGRNVRTPYGEIDLIARLPGRGPMERDLLAFVEVKTRATGSFGYPEESVNPRKQAHLISSALYFIQENPELEGDWRIDVIAIQRLEPDQPPVITHFENAIST